MIVTSSYSAVAINLAVSFLASGGVEPYSYALLPNGAGGTIDATTGLYTAPAQIDPDPAKDYDTIEATDNLGATATAQILVGTPLLLFCEILQKELGLANGRVYVWDQKLKEPTDNGLYIAVSMPICRPYSSITKTDGSGSGFQATQITNVQALVDIDIISRGPSARDRKEEVIMALGSLYSQGQQELNNFYIAKLPSNLAFRNLSTIDGAAIPYRYKISVHMQYVVSKTQSVPYFDTFQEVSVAVDA